jgi:hypothetical protein
VDGTAAGRADAVSPRALVAKLRRLGVQPPPDLLAQVAALPPVRAKDGKFRPAGWLGGRPRLLNGDGKLEARRAYQREWARRKAITKRKDRQDSLP